jgi:hypothetical protein
MNIKLLLGIITISAFCACSDKNNSEKLINDHGQEIYQDRPFLQDYSIKYYLPKSYKDNVNLHNVASDRNGNIQITSSQGLLIPDNGHFMEPGDLIPERTYQYMIDKEI